MNPRISLIIPAHNETQFLPRLLDTVDIARAQYRGGREAIEVIVADNASTDDTAGIARSRGCLVVRVEKRIIAAVRNGGAGIAKGEVFAFVDADSMIHPETFNAIDRALDTGKYVAGATGVKLERMSLGIAVTCLVMIPMVWITGMDTGVVFSSRRDFREIGGYNEKRFFAEDVQLLFDLRRLGRSRGQKLARITSVKAVSSTRKFDKLGEWHYLWLILRFFYGLLLSRKSLDKLKPYWYNNER